MAEGVTWCRTCGKTYNACSTCLSNRNKYYSYKILCCSPIHYQIYQIACDYHNGIIDREQARDLLKSNPDFNEVEVGGYTEGIKNILFEILYEDKPKKISVKKGKSKK